MTPKTQQPRRNSLARQRKRRVCLKNGSVMVPPAHWVQAKNNGNEDWPWFGSQIRHSIKVIRQTVKGVKAARRRKHR